MPARDFYHNAVKTAIIKDGWTITDDPYIIKYEETKLFADLAAEKTLAAERNGSKIIVEIKSFLGKSPINDFENALGQYILYRNLIKITEPQYQLYLAIKQTTYENFFQLKAIKIVVEQNQLLLIVVDVETEVILQWIN
ncbi:XisH family protein [Cylindrospermum sp. FACHB-282]|uniref:XisH family protein n=1 Tax=Cylindrospermum sp. FACHB-282 TaxID=2692794 RepID=UPI0016835B37|nr:XisH family protein [Cylindrospermum sp. FACHB-282]MBD2385288.1 XisH family protein [Cylindrospermum sp. FACHB-282]